MNLLMDIPKPLLTKAIAGDEQSFSKVVQLLLPALYQFIFLIVRDHDLAEDIVQETWIKAWKHRSRFDPKFSFKTWLYTIGKHTAFDMLKKKQPLPLSFFSDEAGEFSFEKEILHEAEIVRSLDQASLAEYFDEALGELPILYRTLLILVYREDYDLHEAASLLGEPYNTIKSRHQRGLKQLRVILERKHASKNSPHSYLE